MDCFLKKSFMRFFFLLISFLCCSSCKKEESTSLKKRDGLLKTFEIEDIKKSKLLVGTNFYKEETLFPSRLINTDDFLVISEQRKDTLMLIIDKKSGILVQKVGLSGEGPNEIGYVWNLLGSTEGKNEFWAYQIAQRKMSKFNLSQTSINPIFEFKLRENLSDVLYLEWVNNDTLIGVIGDGKFKYIEISTDYKEIASFHPWKDILSVELPPENLLDLFQGPFLGKGDGRWFASASIGLDYIELLDRKKKKVIGIQGPIHHIPEFKLDYSPGYPMLARVEETIKYCYLNIAFGENKLYALFSGHSSEMINKIGTKFCEQVFVFDLEGNPMEHYVLDQSISDFTVDEKNRTIYGITIDKNPGIIQFKF
jgi:hypothetical protein